MAIEYVRQVEKSRERGWRQGVFCRGNSETTEGEFKEQNEEQDLVNTIGKPVGTGINLESVVLGLDAVFLAL